MPIYEYLCKKCGEFEIMQRITEPALERCPTCRSKVNRLISTTSFHLKGTGWYLTDYARKGTSGKDSKPSKAENASDKADSSASKADGASAKSDSGASTSSSDSKTSKPNAAAA